VLVNNEGEAVEQSTHQKASKRALLLSAATSQPVQGVASTGRTVKKENERAFHVRKGQPLLASNSGFLQISMIGIRSHCVTIKHDCSLRSRRFTR
jgi:hypothetical protein